MQGIDLRGEETLFIILGRCLNHLCGTEGGKVGIELIGLLADDHCGHRTQFPRGRNQLAGNGKEVVRVVLN